MTHLFDVLSAQIDGCVSWCVRARVVMAENGSSSTFSFPYFSENFWQTNGCVTFKIDRSTYGCDVSNFSEKMGDRLLPRASCATNFCWDCFTLEDPYGGLLFCFGLICIDPWFVICTDAIHSIWLYFCNISLHQSTRVSFCISSNFSGSNANKSFLRPNHHTISYWLLSY
jgi:hypothetical protein